MENKFRKLGEFSKVTVDNLIELMQIANSMELTLPKVSQIKRALNAVRKFQHMAEREMNKNGIFNTEIFHGELSDYDALN
jgi:hypothetical protein